ncbi:MAG: EAL domain-containing protein [Gammaproteobacteria bacterium]|nr:EAL domain-containing protein [Gammaproteobacteria bacterium]
MRLVVSSPSNSNVVSTENSFGDNPIIIKALLVGDDIGLFARFKQRFSRMHSCQVELDYVDNYEEALDRILSSGHHLYFINEVIKNESGVTLIKKLHGHGTTKTIFFIAELPELPHEAQLPNVILLLNLHIDDDWFERKILTSLHDLSVRQQLEERDRDYQRILGYIDEFVYIRELPTQKSPFGKVRYASPRVYDILGYAPEEMLGDSVIWKNMTHPDDLDWLHDIEWFAHQMRDVSRLPEFTHITHETRIKPKHLKDYIWLEDKLIPFFEEDGRLTHFIGVARDITRWKRMEDQRRHDALHDPLTGLANRTLFIDHLNNAILRIQRRPESQFAVLFIDLDRFKNINDVMGHKYGDKLLIAIGERLQQFIRPGDTVARLGGDEFSILLEEIAYADDATFISDRIQDLLSSPLALDNKEVFTTASIGIALSTGNYHSAEDMLRDADTAMYKAKAEGRARYEIFDAELHAKAAATLQMETNLRRAIEKSEFEVHYQPIVSLANGHVVSFEALIRWHGNKGSISPAEFIPLAEETGMIVPIGYWVMREACLQLQRWRRLYPQVPIRTISINLSPRQFSQIDLVEHIDRIISDTGINPTAINFEITESVVMENAECINAILAQFKSMKIKLSMDDFGTGYSSLSYLHRLPIDTLKIDRSFVMRLDSGPVPAQSQIVDTIITLAHNLNLDVVAEGIETAEQLRKLRSLGCEYGQGFYFSPAMSSEQAEVLMQKLTVHPDYFFIR